MPLFPAFLALGQEVANIHVEGVHEYSYEDRREDKRRVPGGSSLQVGKLSFFSIVKVILGRVVFWC